MLSTDPLICSGHSLHGGLAPVSCGFRDTECELLAAAFERPPVPPCALRSKAVQPEPKCPHSPDVCGVQLSVDQADHFVGHGDAHSTHACNGDFQPL